VFRRFLMPSLLDLLVHLRDAGCLPKGSEAVALGDTEIEIGLFR